MLEIGNEPTFTFVGNTRVGSAVSASLLMAGFKAAPDLESCDVIFTFFESQSALEDAYFDAAGLLQRSHEGAVFVDMSPATPEFAKELHAIATVNDHYACDAPLAVRDATRIEAYGAPDNLDMFVGAEEEVYNAVAPLLDAVAEDVHFCGMPGSGQAAKMAVTLQYASSLIAANEAAALAQVCGADPDDLFTAALDSGNLAPNAWKFLQALRSDDLQSGYSIGIMIAEIAAALNAADDHDLIIPQAEAGFHLLELLTVIGGADMSPAALKLVYSDEATCSKHGLDWTRAESAYAHEDEDGCDCGHDHGHDHDHDHGPEGFEGGFPGFSSN